MLSESSGSDRTTRTRIASPRSNKHAAKSPRRDALTRRALRFRFSPRDAQVWPYVLRSDFAGLDGKSGAFTAVPPPPERTSRPSRVHPDWWLDDPDPNSAEGLHPGARSVNVWREVVLRDFAARLRRCQVPAASAEAR